MNDPETKTGFIVRFPVLSFLLLTFVISWTMVLFSGFTIAMEKGQIVGLIGMVLIGQFGPALAAFIVVKRLHGWGGLRAYLRSGYLWKQPVTLIAFAALFYPVLFAVVLGISILRGAPAPEFTSSMGLQLVAGFVPALVLGFLFGGISEEFGWRGFLLPRMQRRFGFIGAGFIIGGLWALWHLEPEYVGVLMTDGWSAFWAKESVNLTAYVKETIPATFIMIWLFNRSKGSIFLMIVIHSSFNACVMVLPLIWEQKPEVWSETATLFIWATAFIALIASLRQEKVSIDAAER